MKKILYVTIAAVFLLTGVCVSQVLADPVATTPAPTLDVDADVEEMNHIFVDTVELHSQGTLDPVDDWITAVEGITAMNFGTLQYRRINEAEDIADELITPTGLPAGLLYSFKYYCSFVSAFTSGRPYHIKVTCTPLTSGATSLGTKGLSMAVEGNPLKKDRTPINDEVIAGTGGYADATGATDNAAKATAVVTNQVIYDGSNGKSRAIAVYISIPPYAADGELPYDAYEPISVDTKAGGYSTTVTYTLTA